MDYMKRMLLLIFLIITVPAFSQPVNENSFYSLRITSTHTVFPDTARVNGHLYDSVLYSAKDHYSDSSVIIIIPRNFKPTKKIDMVFWFHGWFNNIDSAAKRFQLIQQFIASNCNAILVIPETTKDAPDSYGGKLEQPNMFKGLVNDVLVKLKKEKYISKKCKAGNIVLAGHSGAYRVIAYILQNGGLPVKEVLLFDALYSQVDKFLNWIKEDTSHYFVHWYTNEGGGTDEVTAEMIQLLQKENIHYFTLEETDVRPKDFPERGIIFIHSKRGHNDIINKPDNFKLLLENSVLKINK